MAGEPNANFNPLPGGQVNLSLGCVSRRGVGAHGAVIESMKAMELGVRSKKMTTLKFSSPRRGVGAHGAADDILVEVVHRHAGVEDDALGIDAAGALA